MQSPRGRIVCYPTTAQRRRSETEENNLEDIFSSVLSQFQIYHPSGKLKFNNLGILQSLALRTLIKKILPISLKLNFSPNNLGCYGLTSKHYIMVAYPAT